MRFTDKLFEGEKMCFDIPISKQKDYLCKLGIANNDFERSFKQYKGQMLYMSKKKQVFLGILAFFMNLALVPYYILMGLFLKRVKHVEIVSRIKAAEKIIPSSLSSKYQIDLTLWNTRGAVHPRDIGFLFILFFKYGFHQYFCMKVLFKIAKYSALIFKFTPYAILVCDEFSFTSSIMTQFCERHGVKHLNALHGEKLFDLRDSFFRFHKCYIWDEHYRKLFLSLKADPSQFEIELPPSMRFNLTEHYDANRYADYKYYLGEYSEEEIKGVVSTMSFALKHGNSLVFRPHPHYSDINLLRKYTDDNHIELPNDVDIITSISSCKYVVGVDSTVLVQAYFNRREVIIDDVTYKQRAKLLGDLDYILANKINKRLSDLQ